MNLGNILRARAPERPDKTALLCARQTMSYGALDQTSTRLAEWFIAQGLQPGERVAVHWSNSFEVVQIYFALFKAGLIAVAVNVRLKPAEIAYILEHLARPGCVSSEPALDARWWRSKLAPEICSTSCTELPQLKQAHAEPPWTCSLVDPLDLLNRQSFSTPPEQQRTPRG